MADMSATHKNPLDKLPSICYTIYRDAEHTARLRSRKTLLPLVISTDTTAKAGGSALAVVSVGITRPVAFFAALIPTIEMVDMSAREYTMDNTKTESKGKFKALQLRKEKLGEAISSAKTHLTEARDAITDAMIYANDHEITVLQELEYAVIEHVAILEKQFDYAIIAYAKADDNENNVPPLFSNRR